MERLEIRLLGGFDVRLGDQIVQGFESQKVRALFAFLARHRRQPLSRDRLASLLWGEKSDSAARRNLRQALHNLRSVVAAADPTLDLVKGSQKNLQLGPAVDLWLDVEKFEEAIQRGLTEPGPDPFQLTTAARLYTGDFLAGFFIKESPEFEDWMIAEQERLREAAIEAYGTLIGAYLSRGEYRLGIQYARRLLAINPLSEGAHRDLMRLYALSGRRTRSLTQYEKLRRLLMTELGVEPMGETTRLYESILSRDLPLRAGEEADEPAGPLIPLVGRGHEYETLHEHWSEILDGRGRMTLIEGEPGVGKTRLIKSFVDAASSKRHALVLGGRSCEAAPPVAFQPFAEMLLGAFVEILPEEHEDLLRELSPGTCGDLLTMAPELAGIAPALESAAGERHPGGNDLAGSLIEFLDALARLLQEGGERVPVILMLDDLQWADEASLRLVQDLRTRVAERAIWILAARQPGQTLPRADKRARAVSRGDLVLGRLAPREIEEIAFSLVGSNGSAELSALLGSWSAGLPLAVAEMVNFLWDEGVLAPRGAGRWFLQAESGGLPRPPETLQRLIAMRIRRLPNSTRRQLSVAAVLGQQFEAAVLQAAAGEHIEVVEIGLQLMLERWLVRQHQSTWSHSRREPDLVAWAKGARRGTFEFSHEAVREVLLEEINPLRQQTLHRSVAEVLRARRADDLVSICEQLAHHEMAAGEWSRALPCLEQAARNARQVGAADIADWYDRRTVEVLDRLVKRAGSEGQRRELLKKRRALAGG